MGTASVGLPIDGRACSSVPRFGGVMPTRPDERVGLPAQEVGSLPTALPKRWAGSKAVPRSPLGRCRFRNVVPVRTRGTREAPLG